MDDQISTECPLVCWRTLINELNKFKQCLRWNKWICRKCRLVYIISRPSKSNLGPVLDEWPIYAFCIFCLNRERNWLIMNVAYLLSISIMSSEEKHKTRMIRKIRKDWVHHKKQLSTEKFYKCYLKRLTVKIYQIQCIYEIMTSWQFRCTWYETNNGIFHQLCTVKY